MWLIKQNVLLYIAKAEECFEEENEDEAEEYLMDENILIDEET